MSASLNNIYLSLVVATVHRTIELDLFLKSLLKIKYCSFEVIVVDQNTDNRLDEVLSPYYSRFPLKHLKLAEQNASKGRNLGATHASGSWIGFPDDDCCYTDDTIAVLKANIEASKADVILGAVLDFDYNPLGRFYRKKSWINLYNFNGKVNEPSMFFKRAIFRQYEGFNPDFGLGGKYFSAEGNELLVRVLKGGCKIFFNSSIKILHPNKTLTYDKGVMQVAYLYSYGAGCLLIKQFGTWSLWYITAYVIKFFLKLIVWEPKKKQFAICAFKGLTGGIYNSLKIG